ncbi:MAG: glycosyltransferase family 4 protein [Anaerolineae bacterium]|nr:glycosyltransferase family 4 protein [Anaerolineae bacterium]MCB9107223.1 glycosyltransferase family 4 protein [Anaerolineales bacterium]
MRVAMVVPGFSAHPDDWAIPALQNLIVALAEHHQVHLFSLRYPVKGHYDFGNFSHTATGGGQQFGWRSAAIYGQTAWAIVRQHRRTPFDLIHAFWADEPGLAAALAAQIIRRPLVVRLGGWDLTNLPHIEYGAQRILSRRLMVGYALRKAAAIQANSAYQIRQGERLGLPAHKLVYIPAGVDIETFRPVGDERSPGPPVLVQAASLIPVKNQALLLEIVQRVVQDCPTATLHLAGRGPLEYQLQGQADRLNITQNVVWHKKIAYPQMPGLYGDSHLYIQTSWHESQGMAVLEAMACGLPVVGTPVGVAPEVACQPADWAVETLAAQVLATLEDNERYRAWSQQARQTVEARFSLPVVVGQLLRLYEHVVN